MNTQPRLFRDMLASNIPTGSHATDISKVFDENAVQLYDGSSQQFVPAIIKPRFISTVEKLLDAKTDAPFPDNMTFKEFLMNMFNVDFMSADELQTICDAGEMYANGCIKNSQTDASGLIDKWERMKSNVESFIEEYKSTLPEDERKAGDASLQFINEILADLKNQSIKVKL